MNLVDRKPICPSTNKWPLWLNMLSTARPKYRKSQFTERKHQMDQRKNENDRIVSAPNISKLVSERSRTLKKAIKELRPIQVKFLLSLPLTNEVLTNEVVDLYFWASVICIHNFTDLGLALQIMRDKWKDIVKWGSDTCCGYRGMHHWRETQEIKHQVTCLVYSTVLDKISKMRLKRTTYMYNNFLLISFYRSLIWLCS